MTSTALDMPVRYALWDYDHGFWSHVQSAWDSVEDDYTSTTDHLRYMLYRWLRDTGYTSGTYALQAWGLHSLIDSVSVTL